MNGGFNRLSPCIYIARDSEEPLPLKQKDRILHDYMLFYIKKGALKLRMGDDEKILVRGAICLFKPGQIVTLLHHPPGVRLLLLHFDLYAREDVHESFYFEMTEASPYPNPTRAGDVMELPNFLSVRSEAHFEDKLQNIIEAHQEPGPFAEIRAQGYFLQLWSYLLEEQRRTNQPDPEKKFETYRDIRIYIENNYSKPITLMSLGDTFHISPCHLQKIFKKLYGISPYEFITQLRIGKAKELLIYSNNSLTDISQRLGFGSLFAFSRAFERLCGVSPSVFRTGDTKGEAAEQSTVSAK